jgi:hypothetical protein
MPTAIDNLTLMPEVQARAALAGRRLRFSVLAPVGAWLGCGTLRVLRAAPLPAQAGDGSEGEDEVIELVCGYESYERLEPQAELKVHSR